MEVNYLKKLSSIFLIFISMSLAQENLGIDNTASTTHKFNDPIREYMFINNVDFISTIIDLNYDFDEALEILNLDANETSSLGFLWMDCIETGVVGVQGSAEEIGLKSSDLEDYLNLRLKNDLGFLEICESDDYVKKNTLTVNVDVWTVGTDYPIAVHIKIISFTLGSVPDFHNKPFQSAALGVSSPTKISEAVTDSIEELVKLMSVSYLKAVGQ
jgi:hypothetical protein